MLQAEIIKELKTGAYIAVHSESGRNIVYLNCDVTAKYPDRMRQYRLKYRQFQALYIKDIIEEKNDERVKSEKGISSFYYLTP